MFEQLRNSISKVFGKPSQGGSFFTSLYNWIVSEQGLGDLLKANKGWVYTSVAAIAEEVATIDLRMYQVSGKKKTDVSDLNLPPLAILKNPNDFMTFYDLIELYQKYMDLTGRCYWYTPLYNGKPTEIYPLVPSRITVAKADDNKITGYVYTTEMGKMVPFAPEEIVYLKIPDPLNPYTGGYSPTHAASLSIETWESASRWNRNFFKNSAIPEGVLKTEQALTATQLAELKKSWETEYGGVANAKKTAILQKGLDYQSIQVNPKDMDYVNLKTTSRDEILAMYRVPKTVIGITDDVNRANAETTDYVFSKRVVVPRMRRFVNSLNEFWLPRFNMNAKYEFGFIDPTPQNQESTYKNNQIGISSGFMTQNEARAQVGLDPIVGGDVLYLPFNYMPSAKGNDKQSQEGKTMITINAVKKDIIEPSQVTRQNNRVGTLTGAQQDFFANYFKEQGNWIANKLSKIGKGIEQEYFEATIDSDEWKQWLSKLAEPVTEHTMNSLLIGASDSYAELNMSNKFELTEGAKAWIKEFVALEIKNIDDYTKGSIRDLVYTSIQDRLGADAVASLIRSRFDEFSQYRAERIARTETASAYSQGTLFGYKDSGLVKQVYWKTAGDKNVSEICRANESQGPVKIGSVFSSGHQTPPSHPNCRCVLIPVVD